MESESESDTSVTFGEALRRRRAAAGLTQEELAERARLSARAISDLERGLKHRPHDYTVQRLAMALALDPQQRAAFARAARQAAAPATGGLTPLATATAHPDVSPRDTLSVSPPPLVGRAHEEATITALLRSGEARLLTLTGPGGVGKTHLALQVAHSVRDHRLAVFAGGCTLEAAEAVCYSRLPGLPDGVTALVDNSLLDGVTALVDNSLLDGVTALVDDSLLDGVTALVDNSLLYIDEQDDGEPRLDMLETIREYALELPADSGDAETPRRHAAYFMAIAEEAEPRLRGPEQALWLARLDREHDNLRAALRWAAESAQGHDDRATRIGLRLAGALWRFWYVRGHLGEGRAWLHALLALADTDPDVNPARRPPDADAALVLAKALNGAGVLAQAQGEYAPAAALYERGLALRRVLGSTQGIADSLTNLGNVATRLGDHARAAALHGESLALRRALGDPWGIASTLNNLGIVARAQADYARAAALYEESLALYRGLADHLSIGITLNNLGEVARDQGDTARAATLAEESLAVHRRLGDKGRIALSLALLGHVACDHGDLARAEAAYGESLMLCHEVGDAWGAAEALAGLGHVAAARHDDALAAARFGEGLALYRAAGASHGLAYCLEGLAATCARRHEAVHAARLFAAAAALRRDINAPVPPVDRAAHLDAVAGVLAALGDAAFEAAWAEGDAMPLPHVTDAALTLAHGPPVAPVAEHPEKPLPDTGGDHQWQQR